MVDEFCLFLRLENEFYFAFANGISMTLLYAIRNI